MNNWTIRKAGVKYCGNCNPKIDGIDLLTELKLLVGESITFVPWHEANIDLLLIISGCVTDCASRPNYHGPTIVLADLPVDPGFASKRDLLLALKVKIDHIR